MQILLQVLLLVLGFVMLIKGADWFVDGASAVARRFGIPPIVVGLTIVAMGTSLPEAAISISAALKGSAGIAVGNVLGSNIMNILLILGLSAVILPMAVQPAVIRRDMPFLLFITVLMPVLGLPDGKLSRVDGLILLAIFAAYMVWLFISTKKAAAAGEAADEESDEPLPPTWKAIAMILVGAALVMLGSNMAVDAATVIAAALGMSDRLIGLTIIALGTSLPELVTSCTAAKKGCSDMALGNVVGSNMFNILFVLGISATITPIAYPMTFLTDSIICVLTAVLLFVLIAGKKLTRGKGAIMLAAFAAYYTWLFLV